MHDLLFIPRLEHLFATLVSCRCAKVSSIFCFFVFKKKLSLLCFIPISFCLVTRYQSEYNSRTFKHEMLGSSTVYRAMTCGLFWWSFYCFWSCFYLQWNFFVVSFRKTVFSLNSRWPPSIITPLTSNTEAILRIQLIIRCYAVCLLTLQHESDRHITNFTMMLNVDF